MFIFQNKFPCISEMSLTGDQLRQIVDAALEIEEFQECGSDFIEELK